jgi:hypothetical protein
MNLNLIIFILVIVFTIYIYYNRNTTEKFTTCGNTGICQSNLCSSGCKLVLSNKEKNQCMCVPISPTPTLPPS